MRSSVLALCLVAMAVASATAAPARFVSQRVNKAFPARRAQLQS